MNKTKAIKEIDSCECLILKKKELVLAKKTKYIKRVE